MNLTDHEKAQRLDRLVLAMADVLELALDEARKRHPAPEAPVAPRAPPPKEHQRDGLWDVADVARFLRASRSWVYKAAESGQLPCLRVGAMLRFQPDDVRRAVGLKVAEPPPPPPQGQPVVRVPPPVPAPYRPTTVPAHTSPPAVTRPRPAVLPNEAYLSVRQAAEQLGVSTATVYKLAEEGKLPHIRVSNAIRILPADLAQLGKAGDRAAQPSPTKVEL